MSKLITGHEADIEAINHDAAVWENDIKAQLRHIIATAQCELADLDLTHDAFGNQFDPGLNKVNHFALDAIVACTERIKKLQS